MRKEWRILLVEDDPGIGEPLQQLLEFEGYTVSWEKSGRAALQRLECGSRPHLILLDIMMPEMNGWEFREHQLGMAKDVADIPVFVLSADRRAEAKVDESRQEYFFPKPVDVDHLADCIESHLSQRHQ